MKDLFNNLATVVTAESGNVYKYLPYWFREDGDTLEPIFLDNLPKELIEAIEEERSAREVTFKEGDWIVDVNNNNEVLKILDVLNSSGTVILLRTNGEEVHATLDDDDRLAAYTEIIEALLNEFSHLPVDTMEYKADKDEFLINHVTVYRDGEFSNLC